MQVENNIKDAKIRKDQLIQEELNQILDGVGEKTKRSLKLAQEKGAGSWLTALPIKSLGYTLSKQEC